MKVYFDESGQTGTHMFDSLQPFFSLGSTNIDATEAAEIIENCFPRHQGQELKSQKLLRRPKGQRGFIKLAQEIRKQPDRFCASKINKRFVIISKMVDFLVEPLLHDMGFDFYADDYAVRFANSAYFVFENIIDRFDAEQIMQNYNEFARKPNSTTLQSITAHLEAAELSYSNGGGLVLGLMAEGARQFERFHELNDFNGSNEIHVTSVIQCMAHWQAQNQGPFDIIHDESIHFFGHLDGWQLLINPNIEPQVLSLGRKTLTLPIPVTSTTSAKSHECPSLQLCDLIAGFVCRVSALGGIDGDDAFFREAISAGLGELSIFPVDAGSDLASALPQRASGSDIVDRIRAAISKQQ